MVPIFDKYKFELCFRLENEQQIRNGFSSVDFAYFCRIWKGRENRFIAEETQIQLTRKFPFRLTAEVKPI